MLGRMEIRAVLPPEWQQLRALRLQALAGAPAAFGGSLAESLAFPDTLWQQRATPAAGQITFIASEDEHWCGMVVGRLLEHAKGAPLTAELMSLWVAPTQRHSGVAQGLVAAVIAWARAQGARRLLLDVAQDNTAARALYDAGGFLPTGAQHTNPARPEHRTLTLTLDL